MEFDTVIDPHGMKMMVPRGPPRPAQAQQRRSAAALDATAATNGAAPGPNLRGSMPAAQHLNPGSAGIASRPPAPDSAAPSAGRRGAGAAAVPGSPASLFGRLTAVVKNPHAQRVAVHVFWDLDNKHPDWVHPKTMAQRLKQAAAAFGTVQSVVAYGNPRTFAWVPEAEAQRRQLVKLMEKEEAAVARSKSAPRSASGTGGAEAAAGAKPHRCGMCGGSFATAEKLRKHFTQLHARQRAKEMAHPAGRRAYLSNPSRSARYGETEMELFNPPSGINLGAWLQSAGVLAVPVGPQSQAADVALQVRWKRCFTFEMLVIYCASFAFL